MDQSRTPSRPNLVATNHEQPAAPSKETAQLNVTIDENFFDWPPVTDPAKPKIGNDAEDTTMEPFNLTLPEDLFGAEDMEPTSSVKRVQEHTEATLNISLPDDFFHTHESGSGDLPTQEEPPMHCSPEDQLNVTVDHELFCDDVVEPSMPPKCQDETLTTRNNEINVTLDEDFFEGGTEEVPSLMPTKPVRSLDCGLMSAKSPRGPIGRLTSLSRAASNAVSTTSSSPRSLHIVVPDFFFDERTMTSSPIERKEAQAIDEPPTSSDNVAGISTGCSTRAPTPASGNQVFGATAVTSSPMRTVDVGQEGSMAIDNPKGNQENSTSEKTESTPSGKTPIQKPPTASTITEPPLLQGHTWNSELGSRSDRVSEVLAPPLLLSPIRDVFSDGVDALGPGEPHHLGGVGPNATAVPQRNQPLAPRKETFEHKPQHHPPNDRYENVSSYSAVPPLLLSNVADTVATVEAGFVSSTPTPSITRVCSGSPAVFAAAQRNADALSRLPPSFEKDLDNFLKEVRQQSLTSAVPPPSPAQRQAVWQRLGKRRRSAGSQQNFPWVQSAPPQRLAPKERLSVSVPFPYQQVPVFARNERKKDVVIIPVDHSSLQKDQMTSSEALRLAMVRNLLT